MKQLVLQALPYRKRVNSGLKCWEVDKAIIIVFQQLSGGPNTYLIQSNPAIMK